MIDFHSHILPALDDGAKSFDDTSALINELYTQRVTGIVCTPHFYPDSIGIDRFLSKRDLALEQVRESFFLRKDIKFYSGAEVYLSEFLSLCKNLHPLCIEGTSILLLEMPFSPRWPSDYGKIIRRLVDYHSIIPMIAHAERYPFVMKHSSGILKELIDSGCIIQANCDSFLDPQLREKVLKWLDNGLIHVLGTDCHSIGARPPHMKQACDVISRELGPGVLENLESYSAGLLDNKKTRNNNLFF